MSAAAKKHDIAVEMGGVNSTALSGHAQFFEIESLHFQRCLSKYIFGNILFYNIQYAHVISGSRLVS
jgi:hypothetical protein